MLGRLSWSAIPLSQPLPLYAMGVVGLVILGVLITITVKGWWPYLWREWLTSVDHKRIGVMYVILALVMLIRGYSDATQMRAGGDNGCHYSVPSQLGAVGARFRSGLAISLLLPNRPPHSKGI
jgi:hypothetical protein